MELKELNPALVWKNFYALTQIPRPSKKEDRAEEYLYEFGKFQEWRAAKGSFSRDI